jgi:molybdenum cofactor cytidylyltransferase
MAIESKNSSILILAAGNSSRLGSPKQLLMFENQNLLQRTIDAACESSVDNVFLILGAYSDQILENIDLHRSIAVENKHWNFGMGNSLKFGLIKSNEITKNQCVIVAVSDQPYISSTLFNELLKSYYQSHKKLVACSYGQTVGVPVLFDSKYFDQIKALKDEEGAKIILLSHLSEAEIIPFQLGHIDIDTSEDYQNLINL